MSTRPRLTMLDVFRERADRHPDRIAMEELRTGGAAADRRLDWRGWHDASRQAAAALVAMGVAPGDTIAILAGNRMLWPIADLAILMAGAVSVGLYPTSAPAQVSQLLADCGATIAVADTAAQADKLLGAMPSVPALRTVIAEDPAAPGDAVAWDAWLESGRVALGDPAIASELERRALAITPDTLALLVYTSGSTGEPKGARLTHRYLQASAESVRDTLGLNEDESTLSFLPYCHAGERVFGLYTRILCGMRTAHVEDQRRIWDAARAVQPTLFGGLPRYFEKMYEALVVHEATLGNEARSQWAEGIRLGRERSALRRQGLPVPDSLERAWRDRIAPCADVLASLTGARVRLATSGGASLPSEIADYLDAAGMTVLGAYGQTEHLCVAMHRPSCYDTESVGPPMPGTEVRIAEDGELLVRRGDMTFSGYLGRPEATREAFTADGVWLRTGDLAALPADGRLRITGRKKEVIALSNGKKVSPLPIEAALTQDPFIAHAMLYGEGKNFITALLVPSRTMVEEWLRSTGNRLPYEQALQDPAVVARIQAVVDAVNARLSRPEQVRRWTVLGHELAAEQDELTPTMKVRRATVTERYRVLLEPLYQ